MSEGSAKNGRDLFLSVVVIGRNEERSLPALFSSLPLGPQVEWIYVDSRSADHSRAIALAAGARVLLLDEGSVYAPGTGRYAGTLEARGRWILYLDGDMVLRRQFKQFTARLLERQDQIPAGVCAFTGRTRNIYLDQAGRTLYEKDYAVLSPSEYGSLESWGKAAAYSGGAVLYLRRAVLEAGNWNPALLQLEEVDLLSRVKERGGELRALDLPMADHYTPQLGFTQKLKMNFLPRYGEKRLYGAGQVVSAAFRERRLLRFIKTYPYPFLVFGGLALSLPLYLLWPPLPFLLNGIIVLSIGALKRPYFYLVYLGNLLQIFYGLGRYRPFTPHYREISRPDPPEGG